ncbi:MAG: phosphoribosylglycinamide formyltransferase [Vampirovibrionales bacterium]|nr:phosphoribosylglycinamide formyltransferase [Vampirovibrionales bacterium]
MTPLRLAVLISGRGSNLEALLKAEAAGQFDASAKSLNSLAIALVLSNHAEAGGLQIAKAFGKPRAVLEKPAFSSRSDYDAALTAVLQQAQIDWIALAGFDRILGEPLLSAFPGRILNMHPSLLPKFGGKGMVGQAVHQAVLAAAEQESGCTVHEVIADVDAGRVLGQARVPVVLGDTPEALAARVLAQEHLLYPQAIRSHVLGLL